MLPKSISENSHMNNWLNIYRIIMNYSVRRRIFAELEVRQKSVIAVQKTTRICNSYLRGWS